MLNTESHAELANRIYETEPLLGGWSGESKGLDEFLKELERDPFNFTGFTIVANTDHEVFIDDGNGSMRGLIPSNVHLTKVYKLLGDALYWRREGWLKRLLKAPLKLW